MEESVRYENLFLSIKSKKEADDLISQSADTQVMVSTHNPDGIYNDLSGNSEKIIGHNRKELLGTSPYDYFHPDDFQKILKSHAKVTIRPEIDKVEYRVKLKDGSYKRVRSLSRQVKDPSGLEFILVFTFSNE